MNRLGEWRWSSYRWLRAKANRPAWLRVTTALAEAGGLEDNAAGWGAYDRYLAWQTEDGPVGKGRTYVSMSRGWALGSANFRAALVEDFDLAATARAWEVGGAQEDPPTGLRKAAGGMFARGGGEFSCLRHRQQQSRRLGPIEY